MRLEACWLDDVKRMKAYFKWIDKGDGFDPTGATEDYWSVCSEVQSRVLRADGKRPASEFNPVRDYLESRYLDNGRLDLGKAHDLIAIKAWRIWQSKGGDPVRNWLSAEQYVSDFYGHIVAAASEGDTEAARRITGAVTVSEPKHDWHLIINAFEVAIAGSFVNADFPEQLAQAQAQAQAA